MRVASDSTPRIQEAHELVIYILSGIVENAFVAASDVPSPATATASL